MIRPTNPERSVVVGEKQDQVGIDWPGFVLFSYGKKMSRPPQMVGGLLLMIFPYFVPGVL